MNGHGLIRFAALPLVLSSSLLACSEPPRWTGSVEMRDGIELISNPADPLLPAARVTVSQLWAVQRPDWVDPSRVHVQRELLVVVDPPANQVHVVSTSGEVRASLGRPGGGPGELLHLVDAFPVGERLVVLDGGRSSIQYLDLEGNYVSSLNVTGQPWAGFPLASGELLLKGEFLSDPEAESFGDWVTVGEGRDPSAFTALSLEPLPEEQGARCSDMSPWAAGAARMRYTTPRIQVFDAAGGLQGEIRIDLPVEAVSDTERATALSELERTLADRGLPPPFIEQSLVVMKDRWRVKCRFGPLRLDATGRFGAFLEQNPDEFGSGGATLHLLSADGVYLAKVAFPEAWRDFTIADGVVYALTRDPDTDLVALEAYRVALPGSAFVDASTALEEARQRQVGPG